MEADQPRAKSLVNRTAARVYGEFFVNSLYVIGDCVIRNIQFFSRVVVTQASRKTQQISLAFARRQALVASRHFAVLAYVPSARRLKECQRHVAAGNIDDGISNVFVVLENVTIRAGFECRDHRRFITEYR